MSLEANGVDSAGRAWLARCAGMGLPALRRGRSAEGEVEGAGPEGLVGIAGVGGGRGGWGCWSRWVSWRGWVA